MDLLAKISRAGLIVLLSMSLSACSGGESAPEENALLYQGQGIALELAPGWVTVEKNNFNATVPQQTLVAFTATHQGSDILKTLTVVTEDIVVPVTENIAYANANIGETMRSVINYERIEIEELQIGGQQTKIHSFKGKLEHESTTFQIIQTYLVKNQKGYIVTGVLLENASAEEREEVKGMLRSFSFQEA